MTNFGLTSQAAAHRLKVGIIGVGKVGTTIGLGLESAGHKVSAVASNSARSQLIAEEYFPTATPVPLSELPKTANLILIAVPDPQIPGVVQQLAESGNLKPNHIVVHMAGALGADVLAPLATVGALVAAMHPAMTFPEAPTELSVLDGMTWAITAYDPRAQAVAQLLALEMGGRTVFLDEEYRTLYHSALAHGANHLVTLIADAQDVLVTALASSQSTSDEGSESAIAPGPPEPLSSRRREELRHQAAGLLRPLVENALAGALEHGDAALTGPAARGDQETVDRHEMAIAASHPDIAAFYAAAAQHTGQRIASRSHL